MKTYSVSLVLSIEAETKDDAIKEFYKKANECAFDRDSLEVELEKEGD